MSGPVLPCRGMNKWRAQSCYILPGTCLSSGTRNWKYLFTERAGYALQFIYFYSSQFFGKQANQKKKNFKGENIICFASFLLFAITSKHIKILKGRVALFVFLLTYSRCAIRMSCEVEHVHLSNRMLVPHRLRNVLPISFVPQTAHLRY